MSLSVTVTGTPQALDAWWATSRPRPAETPAHYRITDVVAQFTDANGAIEGSPIRFHWTPGSGWSALLSDATILRSGGGQPEGTPAFEQARRRRRNA